MHPLAALDLSGGVARWTELRSLGVGRGRLLRLAGEGQVARPARGVFCRPELVNTVAVRAVCVSGQLTCACGAEALGLELLFPVAGCHVRSIVNPRAQSGAVIHPWGRTEAGRVASLAEVLHDCALCLPTAEAVVVIDSALRKRRVSPADWALVMSAGPRPDDVARVLALTDAQAQSVLESLARVTFVLAGVGEVTSQRFVDDAGWVDLVVDGWLVIELDGWDFHREKFQEDRRRDAELTRRGFVVLRFTYADITRRPAWCVDVVREVLDRGRPPFSVARSFSV